MAERSLHVHICKWCGGFIEAQVSDHEPNRCVDNPNWHTLHIYLPLDRSLAPYEGACECNETEVEAEARWARENEERCARREAVRRARRAH